MSLLAASDIVAGYGRGDEILKGVHLTVERKRDRRDHRSERRRQIHIAEDHRRPAASGSEAASCCDGEPIHGLSPREVSRRGVAFVPQEQNIFPTLSVRENLEMGGWLDPAATRARIDAVFARFPMLAERRAARHALCPADNARCSPWRWR